MNSVRALPWRLCVRIPESLPEEDMRDASGEAAYDWVPMLDGSEVRAAVIRMISRKGAKEEERFGDPPGRRKEHRRPRMGL